MSIIQRMPLCPLCRSKSSSPTTPNYLVDSLVALYFHLLKSDGKLEVERTSRCGLLKDREFYFFMILLVAYLTLFWQDRRIDSVFSSSDLGP